MLRRIRACREHVFQAEAEAVEGTYGIDPEPLVPGKWYHMDECQADVYGPFDTMLAAVRGLEAYCRHYLGE